MYLAINKLYLPLHVNLNQTEELAPIHKLRWQARGGLAGEEGLAKTQQLQCACVKKEEGKHITGLKVDYLRATSNGFSNGF